MRAHQRLKKYLHRPALLTKVVTIPRRVNGPYGYVYAGRNESSNTIRYKAGEERIHTPSPRAWPPHGKLLRVVKPLYGLPESGLYWYLTYSAHHLEIIGMRRVRSAPCVLVRKENDGLVRLVLF